MQCTVGGIIWILMWTLFQMLFLSFDTDRSGKMSSYELRIALKAAGENPLLLLQLEPGWSSFVYRTLTLTLGTMPS